MVANGELMEGEGTVFGTDGNEQKGGRMHPLGNRRMRLSGKTAIFALCLTGVALSMAFPFGLGLVVLSWVIALTGTVFAVGFACYRLLKDLLGGTATFGYAPTTSYMAGKKIRKRRKEESSDEEKKDTK